MESSDNTKQAAYNKNEKSRDIRTTNIQAAKGNSSPTQPYPTASVPVLVPEAWTKWSEMAEEKPSSRTMEPQSFKNLTLSIPQPKW